ncbi:MAG TPA: hypothetical protein G4O02_02430 [Caldilineae bacterium]|nr:hypothetical protein [Caldilineae bacterium]
MRSRSNSWIWGLLLLLGGILILLFNFGVFDALRPWLEYVTAGVAALVGLGFLVYYAYDRTQWWPVLPGLTLLGVGAVIYLGTREIAQGEVLVSLLLLAIALAFAVVYIADPQNWWTIIPGGILLVVGGVILASPRLSADQLGTLLFVGIGLVFYLVYILGPRKREVWWALIPGTALLVSGLFIYVLTVGQEQFIVKAWPVVPALVGLFLLGRTFMPSRRPAEGAPGPSAPAEANAEPDEEAKVSVIELEEAGTSQEPAAGISEDAAS